MNLKHIGNRGYIDEQTHTHFLETVHMKNFYTNVYNT